MDNKQIVAVHHSEERYASLTLIAYSQEQRELIRKVIEKRVPSSSEISISESEVDDILETTIEYHDDYDKQSGEIFETIIRSLHITECN